MKQEILWVLGALALAGLGTFFYFQRKDAALEQQPGVQVQEPAAGAAGEPKVENPLPAAEAEARPLPKLKESDPAVRDALTVVLGDQSVAQYLVPNEVIRRFVVTVDNLPRKKVAVELRPVKS